MDSSPVKTDQPSKVAAIGAIKYKREPESPTSTTSLGRWAELPAPFTTQSQESEVSTQEPKRGTALLAEMQSAPPKGFLI